MATVMWHRDVSGTKDTDGMWHVLRKGLVCFFLSACKLFSFFWLQGSNSWLRTLTSHLQDKHFSHWTKSLGPLQIIFQGCIKAKLLVCRGRRGAAEGRGQEEGRKGRESKKKQKRNRLAPIPHHECVHYVSQTSTNKEIKCKVTGDASDSVPRTCK